MHNRSDAAEIGGGAGEGLDGWEGRDVAEARCHDVAFFAEVVGALLERGFAVMREEDVVTRPETPGYSVADAACAGDYEDGERGRVESGARSLGGC